MDTDPLDHASSRIDAAGVFGRGVRNGCNGVVAALALRTDRVRRAAPYQRAMRGAVDFLKTYLTEFQKNDLPGLSAELAYRFLFAIFPFGLFVAALTAFVAQGIGMSDPSGQIMGALGDNLPPDVAAAVQPELQRVLDVARPGLLTIGALAALWAATGGTNALIKGTNKAFEVEDKRSFVVKTALAIALTLLATIGILVAFVTIVGGSLLTEQLAEQVGIGGAWQTISLIRWPLVAVALTLAVAILFHFAPAIRPSWRWCIVGGVVFTVGWLATTALFAFYVSNVANFGADVRRAGRGHRADVVVLHHGSAPDRFGAARRGPHAPLRAGPAARAPELRRRHGGEGRRDGEGRGGQDGRGRRRRRGVRGRCDIDQRR